MREFGLSLKRFVFVFPLGIYTKYKQLLAKDKLIFRRLSKVSTKEMRLGRLSMFNLKPQKNKSLNSFTIKVWKCWSLEETAQWRLNYTLITWKRRLLALSCLLFVLPASVKSQFVNHGPYNLEKFLNFNFGCTVLKSPWNSLESWKGSI